jgi:hypothetical protein
MGYVAESAPNPRVRPAVARFKSASAEDGEAKVGSGARKDAGQAEDEHFHCSFAGSVHDSPPQGAMTYKQISIYIILFKR